MASQVRERDPAILGSKERAAIMKILTQSEERALKGALTSLEALGTPFYSITLGEGDAAAMIKVDEGIIKIQNSKLYEMYGNVQSFAFHYDLI
jgi:hypothetical protein